MANKQPKLILGPKVQARIEDTRNACLKTMKRKKASSTEKVAGKSPSKAIVQSGQPPSNASGGENLEVVSGSATLEF